nr:MAG TPA: hypothetical protein [Caudoviricetes sp.]
MRITPLDASNVACFLLYGFPFCIYMLMMM